MCVLFKSNAVLLIWAYSFVIEIIVKNFIEKGASIVRKYAGLWCFVNNYSPREGRTVNTSIEMCLQHRYLIGTAL